VSQCLGLTDLVGEKLYLSMPQLEALDLSYTAISSDVVSYLAALPALKELRCRGCEGIDDDALVALEGNGAALIPASKPKTARWRVVRSTH
jgi:hypothetical protein